MPRRTQPGESCAARRDVFTSWSPRGGHTPSRSTGQQQQQQHLVWRASCPPSSSRASSRGMTTVCVCVWGGGVLEGARSTTSSCFREFLTHFPSEVKSVFTLGASGSTPPTSPTATTSGGGVAAPLCVVETCSSGFIPHVQTGSHRPHRRARGGGGDATAPPC